MDDAEISRRLKAGRWLAGGIREDGKPTPLTTAELALRPPLAENGITVNRIEEIEQLKLRDRGGARPMELEKIAQALGMPNDWFTVEKVAPIQPDANMIGAALSRLEERVVALAATRPELRTRTPDTSVPNGTTPEVPRVPARGTEGSA